MTVGLDGSAVENALGGAAPLTCPVVGCAGVLGPWGWARERVVRGAGLLRPRRVPSRSLRWWRWSGRWPAQQPYGWVARLRRGGWPQSSAAAGYWLRTVLILGRDGGRSATPAGSGPAGRNPAEVGPGRPAVGGPGDERQFGVSKEQDQDSARRARASQVGLFRYGLIQDALAAGLSTKQRGRLVRAVAAGTHPGPFGAPVRVSRASLDRWIRDYRRGGFTALVPAPRRVTAGTPAQVLQLAMALKTEAPDRTAAQVAAVLAAHGGFVPSARTLQRHFAAAGLTRTCPDGAPPAVFGRFEAERPNARWVGDALHGPIVAGRKAILIAFLDDYSRAVVAARWGYAENAVALRETLRVALASRGRPAQLYVDNGAMFIDSALR